MEFDTYLRPINDSILASKYVEKDWSRNMFDALNTMDLSRTTPVLDKDDQNQTLNIISQQMNDYMSGENRSVESNLNNKRGSTKNILDNLNYSKVWTTEQSLTVPNTNSV